MNFRRVIEEVAQEVNKGKPEAEHTMISFRTSKSFRQKLREEAKKQNRTVGGLIKHALIKEIGEEM